MNSTTSDLWDSLSSSLFGTIDDELINTFRRTGGANNRLGAWDPLDKTMRYYKSILFDVAQDQPDRFFEFYRSLGDVSVGDPVSVRVRGCDINIDYLFSVEEAMFIDSTVPLAGLKSVVEVGAGFGRTCHGLLALAPSIERYVIVDIKNVLAFSRRVLERAVPHLFHKITFIDAADRAAWSAVRADLAINIDSFQEMPPSTIDAYMAELVSRSKYFYVKNPLGKFRPESIGLAVKDPAKFHDVFSLGYCRDVIDLFDDESLTAARAKYLKVYAPSGGRLLADKPLNMFRYFHHALYQL